MTAVKKENKNVASSGTKTIVGYPESSSETNVATKARIYGDSDERDVFKRD